MHCIPIQQSFKAISELFTWPHPFHNTLPTAPHISIPPPPAEPSELVGYLLKSKWKQNKNIVQRPGVKQVQLWFHLLQQAHLSIYKCSPTAAHILSPKGNTCNSRSQLRLKVVPATLSCGNFHTKCFFRVRNHFPHLWKCQLLLSACKQSGESLQFLASSSCTAIKITGRQQLSFSKGRQHYWRGVLNRMCILDWVGIGNLS